MAIVCGSAAGVWICPAPTRIEQIWGEQTVIRMLNGFSVVVNYRLHEEMEASMMVYE